MKTLTGIGLSGLAIIGALTCRAPLPTEPNPLVTPVIDSVFFSEAAKGQIRLLYAVVTSQNNLEIAGCLHGSIDGKVASVKYTRLPEYLRSFPDSVQFTCDDSKDFLGDWHSHPVGNPCLFSPKDFKHFEVHKKSFVSAVACSNGITVYTK